MDNISSRTLSLFSQAAERDHLKAQCNTGQERAHIHNPSERGDRRTSPGNVRNRSGKWKSRNIGGVRRCSLHPPATVLRTHTVSDPLYDQSRETDDVSPCSPQTVDSTRATENTNRLPSNAEAMPRCTTHSPTLCKLNCGQVQLCTCAITQNIRTLLVTRGRGISI